MYMKELVYLHSIGLTHKKLFQLFSREQNYADVFYNLSESDLKKAGCSSTEIPEILSKYQWLDTKKIDSLLTQKNITIITFFDLNYPPLLKMASQVPFLLYVRWKIEVNDNFFAVVGSRKMSVYGKKAGQKIIWDLSEYFTIVSWWAGWCDTLAHQICVEKSKKTIVVFGTGIDLSYPSGNAVLFEKVIENWGALVSIFPLGTPGSVYTFPVRNEVVAGMSRGVLVLEAGKKSGTLITAQLALDQGKDVFAIPWDLFHPNFEGSHDLIKKSAAQMITSSQDILEEYHFSPKIPKVETLSFENEIQSHIFELLKYNLSLNIDEIIEKTSFSYGEISLNLSLLELQGILKKDLFGKYERIG